MGGSLNISVNNKMNPDTCNSKCASVIIVTEI